MTTNSSWQTYLFRVIAGDEKGLSASTIRGFLDGLEFIYRGLSRFKYTTARRHRLPVPVISIGNITVGGTGKTPTVVWLVRKLKAAGFTPAVLTRGYGGSSQAGGMIFTSSDLAGLTAQRTGDEPFLLAKMLGDTTIVVGRERYLNGLQALRINPDIDLFILDDGFQHWGLERDLDVVIIDASRPFSNRHLLPRGFLREPLSSLKRAGVILLTRTAKLSEDALNQLTVEISAFASQAVVATITEESPRLIPLIDFSTGRENGVIPAAQFLSGRKVAAVTGIGNPRQFLASLENMGAEVGYFQAYPDHYHWEEHEIIDLVKGLAENGFSELIITAKDGVKFETGLDKLVGYPLTCYILSLGFTVTDELVTRRIEAVTNPINS
ncbi:MAG TPA: tetraacyldisaccharide 4'-kinase [Firmicutes bacterium]|nr:tetraacyldisaccharide 4'-kinase [Bacillota bacterium]